MWSLLSCSLLNALQEYTPGVLLESVDRILTHQCIDDLFVNNNDMMFTSHHDSFSNELVQVCKDRKKANQAWECFLYNTSGSLALKKHF